MKSMPLDKSSEYTPYPCFLSPSRRWSIPPIKLTFMKSMPLDKSSEYTPYHADILVGSQFFQKYGMVTSSTSSLLYVFFHSSQFHFSGAGNSRNASFFFSFGGSAGSASAFSSFFFGASFFAASFFAAGFFSFLSVFFLSPPDISAYFLASN